ncbi:MAG: DUF6508 domain-containing protein [Candidatus Limnocylindrales bacterium]
MDDVEPLTRDELRCLADWLPILDAPGYSLGRWSDEKARPDGAIPMPYFEFDPRRPIWPGTCGGLSMIRAGFDWNTWLQGPSGRAIAADPATVARATPLDLARLVTAIVRGDRFTEGNIEAAFERGFLMAISRRAAALLEGAG